MWWNIFEGGDRRFRVTAPYTALAVDKENVIEAEQEKRWAKKRDELYFARIDTKF